MDVSARGDPDSLEPRMSQHLVVVAIHIDTEFLVFFIVSGPLDLVAVGGTHSYNTSPRDAVQQGMDMAFTLRRVSATRGLRALNDITV